MGERRRKVGRGRESGRWKPEVEVVSKQASNNKKNGQNDREGFRLGVGWEMGDGKSGCEREMREEMDDTRGLTDWEGREYRTAVRL